MKETHTHRAKQNPESHLLLGIDEPDSDSLPFPVGQAAEMDNRPSVGCIGLPCYTLALWTLNQVRHFKKDVDTFMCSVFLYVSRPESFENQYVFRVLQDQ